MFRARHPVLYGIALGLLAGVIFGILLWVSGRRPLVGGVVCSAAMTPSFAVTERKTKVTFPQVRPIRRWSPSTS